MDEKKTKDELWNIYDSAVKIGDFRLALDILREIDWATAHLKPAKPE